MLTKQPRFISQLEKSFFNQKTKKKKIYLQFISVHHLIEDIFLMKITLDITCAFKGQLNVNPLSANPTKWTNTFKQFVNNEYTILFLRSGVFCQLQ